VILTLYAIVSREKTVFLIQPHIHWKSIVEINGSRDKHTIKEFSNVIRVQDGKDFNKYLDMVEPGIGWNRLFLPLINFQTAEYKVSFERENLFHAHGLRFSIYQFMKEDFI
jgi:hypothetical protein